MPNGKYDFGYDEPVNLPDDAEATFRALLNSPSENEADEGDEGDG